MKTTGYISVFAGLLFAALSGGSNHYPLKEFSSSAAMHISWKEMVSLILMLAGGILLLISAGKEKESSLRKS